MFFRGSRYEAIPEAEFTAPDGRLIRYKGLRLIPRIAATRRFAVRDVGRPDLAAALALGDPERYWQLCDANRVMRPADLVDRPDKLIAAPKPGDL